MRHLLLLVLFLFSPLWGATVTSSITGTGAAAPISLPANQFSTSSSYTLSGTWVGTMLWQYSQSGSGNWNTLATYTGNIGPVVFANPGFYRWNCSAYTSGTVTAAVTTPYFIYQQVNNNQGSTVFQVDDSGFSGVTSSSVVPGSTIAAQYLGNVNNYFELYLQNQSAGVNASTDYVATADNGSQTTHYVDLGINGSVSGAAPFTGANEAYVYSTDNILDLGALGATGTVNVAVGATPKTIMNVDYSTGVSVNDVTDPTKQLRFLPSGQSTATILTLNTGAQTVSRTLSVPVLGGADTLGTLATAQTFTGLKTFNAGLTSLTPITFQDASDATKQFAWLLSNQTAGTTLTLNSGAQSASRQLNIPVLAGTDTLATLAVANSFSGIQTVALTTAASSATTGSMIVGTGTAATSTGIGGGNVNTGGSVIAGSSVASTTTMTSGTAFSTTNGDITLNNTAGNGTLSIKAASASNARILMAVNGSNTGMLYSNATNPFVFDDLINSTLPLVYTPGALSAAYWTDASTLAASSATAGGFVNSGGYAAAKASWLGTIGTSSTGNVIAGDQSGAADTAGQVGEVVQGTNQSTYTNFTTTNALQQVAVLTSLGRGRWKIIATGTYFGNGATVAALNESQWAISTTTASAAGAVEGRSIGYVEEQITSSIHTTVTLSIDANIAAATSYFLNAKAQFTGGNPQFVGSLTAYRIR